MARKYGLPYKGSKNAIADWVIEHLPGSGTLVDLFCGGCAVTHAALLSGKWERIIANDLHGDAPQLFLDAISGKYTTETEKRWISREDFYRLKDTDAYVRLCWSFGNDGNTYLYAKEIEPFKKRLHELVFADTVAERMSAWRAFVAEFNRLNQDVDTLNEKLSTLGILQRVQGLQGLQRLKRLQGLQELQELQVSGLDYRDVEIPGDAVVYCDIPYNCTADNYGVRFDRAEFLDWADAQTALIIISEYCIDDDRFAMLAEIEKRQLIQGSKHQKKMMERLYCPRRQLDEILTCMNAQEKMTI